MRTWVKINEQLNSAKSGLIWFGSQVNLERLATTDVSVLVIQTVIQPSDRIRGIGIILGSSLSMRQHIARVTSASFIFPKIGKVLDEDSCNRLVCAVTHWLLQRPTMSQRYLWHYTSSSTSYYIIRSWVKAYSWIYSWHGCASLNLSGR